MLPKDSKYLSENLFIDNKSQFANSSLDCQYIHEELDYLGSLFKSKQQSNDNFEAEMKENKESISKSLQFSELAAIIDAGFKQINHNIDMLIISHKLSLGILKDQRN